MSWGRLGRLVLVALCACCPTAALHAADVLLPVDSIAPETQRVFLVSVGVDSYTDDFWPALRWASADARRVGERFGRDAPGEVIRHVRINDAATAADVRATLASVAASATRADTVIMYVSAHGTLAQTPTGELERVIVLHDTQRDSPLATGLGQSELGAWLDRLAARKKLIIFATCHSGEGKSRVPESVRVLLGTPKGKLVSLADVSEGALVLAAAAKNEAALEDDRLQGDVYTHFVLEALDTYDRNKDGVVSALEAHDYARDRTWQHTQGRQRPTANARFVGDADVPLSGRKTQVGLPVLEAYDERLAGFRVEVDGRSKGEVPTAFPLSAEGSVIAVYGPQGDTVLARYRVRAAPGEAVTLDDVVLHRPWLLGIGWRHSAWSAGAWSDVVGTDSLQQWLLAVGAQRGRWGLQLLLPTQSETQHELRPALSATTTLSGAGLAVEYRVPTANWAWSVTGELWSEELDIAFADGVTGDIEGFAERALSYSVGGGLHRRLAGDVWAKARGGWRSGEWAFDRIGELSGDALWLELGMEYRFGGKARTL